MAHYDVLREQLASLHHGYALWEPDPAGYECVRVGDVGHIRRGRFYRLFNALLPAEDPSHELLGVPDDFVPLRVDSAHLHTKLLPRGDYCTSSVHPVDVSLGVQVSADALPVASTFRASFSCEQKQGAVLSLPVDARREDTLERERFQAYILENAESWMSFAHQRNIVIDSLEELVLVTGCDSAQSWAVAAFTNPSPQAEIALGIALNSAARNISGSALPSLQWRAIQTGDSYVPCNFGQRREQTSAHGHCVFIRGYRVKKRGLAKLPVAAGRHSSNHPESGGSPSTSLSEKGSGSNFHDPLNSILDFLLDKLPQADFAVVHDDDLQYIRGVETLSAKAVYRYLERMATPHLTMLQTPVAQLSDIFNSSIQQTLSSSDINRTLVYSHLIIDNLKAQTPTNSQHSDRSLHGHISVLSSTSSNRDDTDNENDNDDDNAPSLSYSHAMTDQTSVYSVIRPVERYSLFSRTSVKYNSSVHSADVQWEVDVLKDPSVAEEQPSLIAEQKDISVIEEPSSKEPLSSFAQAEQIAQLWKYNENLVWRPGKYVDLGLLDGNRSLIHAGKLLCRPNNGLDWVGSFVLLFDNYLVITMPEGKNSATKYRVMRHPIPLELLAFSSIGNLSARHGGGRTVGDVSRELANAGTAGLATKSPAQYYPMLSCHTGRLEEVYHFYADNVQERSEWCQKVAEAKKLRNSAQTLFRVETMSAETISGRVTCSVPFTTTDKRELVAVGCAEGVWTGFRYDARSMRSVLHLKAVMQCDVLEDFGVFLVLANNSLFAYPIDVLAPSWPNPEVTPQTQQKLSGSKVVQFFRVGKLDERTLIIYMTETRGVSIFHALEPAMDKINIGKTTQSETSESRLGFRTARSDCLPVRMYKEFLLPLECHDLIFLTARRLAILCKNGFEIMDLINFKSVTIPQRDDHKYEHLYQRCDSSRPMGMFRASLTKFLLCYKEFGLFVDRSGKITQDKSLIEWEGTAKHIAWHPPYILIFDPSFIEVRSVETGRLCQIIRGENIRATWYSRGSSQIPQTYPREGQTWADVFSPETSIHGVMSSRSDTAEFDNVFELVPCTIPPSASVSERQGSPATESASGVTPTSKSPPQGL